MVACSMATAVAFLALALAFLVVQRECSSISQQHEFQGLPLIPADLVKLVLAERANRRNATTNKHIPANVWIAVRNSSDPKPGHFLGPKGFIARNADWSAHFCKNHDKDLFMQTAFAGTSLLWAYNILNPLFMHKHLHNRGLGR